MISIIICSRKEGIDPFLWENINRTIGVPFEIINIDNQDNRYSIFSAYNLGALRSKYDNLCFMHDDIIFHGDGWGKVVTGLLSAEQTGVVGVAGAVVKTRTASPWWVSNVHDCSKYFRQNLIQTRGTEKRVIHEEINPEKEACSKVAVIDGVWFCCRRDLWDRVKFDESNFGGFHFYDLDFSLAVLAKGYTNLVTYEVLLEHRSSGHLDGSWVKAALRFQKKWEKRLPVSVVELSREELNQLEYQAIRNLLVVSINNDFGGFFYHMRFWLKLIRYKGLSRMHFSLLKSILKEAI